MALQALVYPSRTRRSPYGLTVDVLAALERLESDPTAGVLASDGLRYHVVKVQRAPLVLNVLVGYTVLEEQRLVLVLVQRVALDEADGAHEG